VATATGELILDAEEIDWIEAEDYCAGIHVGKSRYRIRESLAALEIRLDPARFVRVHRAVIVRLDQIRALRIAGDDTNAVLVLRDGTELPVSRRRLPHLRALLRPTPSR
jgi:two-component system LytT family response regulator